MRESSVVDRMATRPEMISVRRAALGILCALICGGCSRLVVAAVATARASDPNVWWRNGVCYEVFVRSFYDSDGDGIGDLRGLTARLDYINDGNPASKRSLGANCIWLMPIDKSASYHGYDVIDYYHVDPHYGTDDDFRNLVQSNCSSGRGDRRSGTSLRYAMSTTTDCSGAGCPISITRRRQS